MTIEKNISETVKDFTCGFCFAQSGYKIAFADHSELRAVFGDFCEGCAFAVVRCRACGMLNVLVFRVVEKHAGVTMSEIGLSLYLAENPHVIDWDWTPIGEGDFGHAEGLVLPTWLELMGQYPYGYTFDDSIPEAIRQDLQEAGNCLAVNAVNASAVMCRRVVERLASSSGIKPQRTLHKTLQILREEGRIDETLFNALSEIKYWGNLGAHTGADDVGPNSAQARELLQLVTQAVEYACSKDRLEKSIRELLKHRGS